MFEELYNVTVIYSTYDSNELMYQNLKSGGTDYDVIIPSDYMIERLIDENLLVELNFELIPNASLIEDKFFELSEVFDPENKYSVPYFWGTVGIIYDQTKVTKTVDSWEILWDEDYKNQIFMYDSQRDSLMVALKLLGYSMNTTSTTELEEARDKLIEQSPLVYSYVTDAVIDHMIRGDAALAVVYSGDAAYIMYENENMNFAIPKEGTNFWIDSMVIPTTSKNVDLAHAFINFMCDPEIAAKNTEYVMYSTPIPSALQYVEDLEWTENLAYNPRAVLSVFNPEDENAISTEIYRHLGYEVTREYSRVWDEVLAAKHSPNYWIPIIIVGVALLGAGYYFYDRKRKAVTKI